LTMHNRLKTLLAVCCVAVPVIVTGAGAESFAQDTKRFLPAEKTAANPAPPAADQAALTYKAEGLKDPFRARIRKNEQPVVETKKDEKVDKPLPNVTIEGIMWGGKFPQVIVNGQVAKAGDTIVVGGPNAEDKVRVETINKDGITVSFNNRTYDVLSPTQASLAHIARKAKGGTDEKEH